MPIDFPSSPTNGQEFSSGSVTWTYDGTAWNLKSTAATTNDSMPIGAIMWFANTTTTPPGWLAADGTNVSRTTYAALFAVIGTTYGSGDGSTTFGLPNISATTGKYYVRYTTALGTTTTTSLSTAPVGTMLDWPTTSSYPTGYLRANGDAVSRTSYADLFALIGTTYGVGDNSTTFNLPNLPAAGAGSPVKIIKASLGGIVEPSTVAHAASHTEGGSDVVTVTGNQIANYQSNRNLIINGAMQIAQRSTSVTGITTSGYRTADRWQTTLGSLGTWTQTVETDAPTGSGLRRSLKLLCTTASASPASGGVLLVEQGLEGFDVQRIRKGTTSALPISLSFWVKANVTGTYVVEIRDGDNTRHICRTYTINASATWEKKEITIPADTTGAFDNDNNLSLSVQFWLGAGSTFNSGTLATSWAAASNANRAVGQTNLAAATNNYWQVTGVQLEAGDAATPFEFEPFETTLRKCHRYFYRIGGNTDFNAVGFGHANTTSAVRITSSIPPMRAKPTIQVNGSLTYNYNNLVATLGTGTMTNVWSGGPNAYSTFWEDTGTVAANTAGSVYVGATTSDYVDFSAEL